MKLNICKPPARAGKVAPGKMLLKFSSLLAVAAVLAGCPAANQTTPASAPQPNKVVIRGSNTIGEELAPRLAEEFKRDHPGVEFDIVTKGTGYGLAALRIGECDLGAASRLPTKDEAEEARGMNVELAGANIGAYSAAVVVNQNNVLTNLTKEQVRDIFTGKIGNWKEAGGPDAPIHLYVRDPVSGTYLGFKELAMDNRPYAAGRKLLKSYAEIAEAVAQDENGIGYTGIAKNPGAVKSVAIGGVAPTAESVSSGKYPYTRGLYFFVKKDHESASAKDFVQFVLSPKGQEILAQLGFVPHP